MIKKIALLIVLLFLTGCSAGKTAAVTETFEETPVNKIQENVVNSKDVVLKTYYKLSDGTWKTGKYTYKYKLMLTGRPTNALRDTTFTILSNVEGISFKQAWSASGISSNLNDYFKEEDAVIVAHRIG